VKLLPQDRDDSQWIVTLRCSFFKGEIKSVKMVSSSGNPKIDAQAIAQTKGRHVPEVAFGTSRHEYWRTMTWAMPKGAPYAAPNLPPALPPPTVLMGVPFAIVCGVTSPSLKL
jgi:hypothetical protein